MIASLVRVALNQRLVVVLCALVLFAFGLQAARKLAVDAFPDVTNVQVQIATDAPGRSPEEVERFITVPLENTHLTPATHQMAKISVVHGVI